MKYGKTEYRSIDQLVKLPDNPRIIGNTDFQRLVKSLKKNPELFEARPIILSDRTGELVILAGNQRYQASIEAGLQKVPTFLIQGLTEEKEREITIRDNVENGKWDFDLLQGSWDAEELSEWGVDLPKFDDIDTDIEPESKSKERELICCPKCGFEWAK